MDSIIQGLRVEHKLFLVRNPLGSISSHIRGEKIGAMHTLDDADKEAWFELNKEHKYIVDKKYTAKDIVRMSSAELHAVNWRLYHEDLKELKQEFPNAIFCFYDDFVEHPLIEVKGLFEKIGLQYESSIEDFIGQSTGKERQPFVLKDTNNEFYSVYRPANFDKESWKKILSEQDVERVSFHAGEYFLELRNEYREIT